MYIFLDFRHEVSWPELKWLLLYSRIQRGREGGHVRRLIHADAECS